VLRQPDPLQPDDQDELEPAARHRCEQRGEVPGGERADAEQLQVEHRLLDANFGMQNSARSPRPPKRQASTRIALEFAKTSAPPTPCPTRIRISQSAPALPVHPRDREQDREEGEDREAEVEHAHAAVHVAKAAEADEQNGEHDEEAEQQPEEVARVARLQRVDADAAEDVRQRDQQDRAVDHREQRPERGVRERHPLVVELPPARLHLSSRRQVPGTRRGTRYQTLNLTFT